MAQPPDISLTAEQREAFNRQGVLLLPQFYDLEAEIRPIQHARTRSSGSSPSSMSCRSSGRRSRRIRSMGYNALIARDRSVGSAVYDAAKLIPAFLRMLASGNNERLFAAMRDTDAVGIGAASFGMRIDNPREEQFRSQWHQESYQPQSLTPVVLEPAGRNPAGHGSGRSLRRLASRRLLRGTAKAANTRTSRALTESASRTKPRWSDATAPPRR